ncbi:MAG TPA: hypothetical protein VD947_01980 [Patescibacteria group bacterium]|nr:hypothetical protein [Patescibacteria group bacterium]
MTTVANIETGFVESGKSSPDFLSRSAQFIGKSLCYTRPKCGRLIGMQFVSNPGERNLELAAATGAVGVGDKGDGIATRYAAKREGRETTAEGAREDIEADQKWTKIMLEAQIAEAFLLKDYKRAALLLACSAVMQARDGIVDEVRDQAEEIGVDAKANWFGKIKTGLNNTLFTFEASPYSQTKTGRKISNSGRVAVAGVSAISGGLTVQRLKKGIAEASV